jgi:hypothetical protein
MVDEDARFLRTSHGSGVGASGTTELLLRPVAETANYDRRDREQKEHNDKMLLRVTVFGVIVTFIVGLAGFWAAYEAHIARKEALTATTDALKLQRDVMQLDERPYIAAGFGGMGKEQFTSNSGQPIQVGVPHLRIMTHGRTPAFQIKVEMTCTDGIGRQYRAAAGFGTMFSEERQTAHCWLPPQVNQVKTTQVIFRIEGVVTYEDMFQKQYRVPFCYLKMIDGVIYNCRNDDDRS